MRSQIAIAKCWLDAGKRADEARANAMLMEALAVATEAGMGPAMQTIQQLLRICAGVTDPA